MQEIQTFDFTDIPVRTTDQNGQPLFAAPDICRVLDLSDPSSAVRDLDDDEKITLHNERGNPRAGIPHQMTFVTESGLYALIFKSRKPEARAFRRWVTSEVLPAIRQTGSYSLPAGVRRVHGILEESIERLSRGEITISEGTEIRRMVKQYMLVYGEDPKRTIQRAQAAAAPQSGRAVEFFRQCIEEGGDGFLCTELIFEEYTKWCERAGLLPHFRSHEYLSRELLARIPTLRDIRQRHDASGPDGTVARRMCYEGLRFRNWMTDPRPATPSQIIEITETETSMDSAEL